MPRILLVIGHHKLQQGTSTASGETEYSYWSKVLPQFRKFKNVFVFSKDACGSTGLKIKAKEIEADFVIECHCNSYRNSHVSGHEVLYSVNSTMELATIVNQVLNDNSPTQRDRGIKKVVNGQRGFFNLKGMKNAIILEPFFMSCKKDYIDKDRMVDIVTDIIDEIQDRYYR